MIFRKLTRRRLTGGHARSTVSFPDGGGTGGGGPCRRELAKRGRREGKGTEGGGAKRRGGTAVLAGGCSSSRVRRRCPAGAEAREATRGRHGCASLRRVRAGEKDGREAGWRVADSGYYPRRSCGERRRPSERRSGVVRGAGRLLRWLCVCIG